MSKCVFVLSLHSDVNQAQVNPSENITRANNKTTENGITLRFCFFYCPCTCVCLLHVRISGTQPDSSPHHKELIDQSRCRAAPLLRAAAETLWSLWRRKGGTAPPLQPESHSISCLTDVLCCQRWKKYIPHHKQKFCTQTAM